MTCKPTKAEIERIRDAAMKIVAERGVAVRLRMPGKADAETTPMRRAEIGGFVVAYVPEPDSAHDYHIQIVHTMRPLEPLAKIDFDDFGGVKSWPLLPGEWQQALISEADKLAARKLN